MLELETVTLAKLGCLSKCTRFFRLSPCLTLVNCAISIDFYYVYVILLHRGVELQFCLHIGNDGSSLGTCRTFESETSVPMFLDLDFFNRHDLKLGSGLEKDL